MKSDSEIDILFANKLKELLIDNKYEEYLEYLHEELKKVVTEDIGEPLVSLHTLPQTVVINLVDLHIETIDTDRLRLRSGVVVLLKQVEENLPKGYHLMIRDAFRSKLIVEQLRALYIQREKEKNPNLSDQEASLLVEMFLATSDDIVPPGHMTGGALDVVLAYDDGTRVPMEVSYDLIPRAKQIRTICEGLPQEIMNNRKILVEAMESVGFHNYSGEYWHYSYGDAYWAVRRKDKKALYGIPA